MTAFVARSEPYGPPRPQTCGRCREQSPGDATLLDTSLPEWWACPSCRDRLLGAGARPAAWAHKGSGA